MVILMLLRRHELCSSSEGKRELKIGEQKNQL